MNLNVAALSLLGATLPHDPCFVGTWLRRVKSLFVADVESPGQSVWLVGKTGVRKCCGGSAGGVPGDKERDETLVHFRSGCTS